MVAQYLDCGIFEQGFACIRCPDCAAEFLLAFSCKTRGLCPSCGAKRAAEFAAFLQDEVVADVGHARRVFTAPKLLRPYLMHHRELLDPICAAAWQAVRELMAVAAGEEKGFRPGMVAMSQTWYGLLRGEERRRYETIVSCRVPGPGWHRFEQEFHPTRLRPEVTTMRVMLFAYWPPDIYWFDNVRIEPIAPDAHTPPAGRP